MIKVTLIGTGNVAFHLYHAFKLSNEVEIVQVFGRKKGILGTEKEYTILNESAIKSADVYLIAVSDDAIVQVAQQLKNVNGLVVHTSGSIGLNALPKSVSRGVFYPLQSFSKSREVDFKKIPICIETENPADNEMLDHLAASISCLVHKVSSEKRAYLHLAAVFVNNFVNHLYQIGEELSDQNDLPFTLLHPLIKETAQKIETLSPKEAQTGPAKRGDTITMQNHLALLKEKNIEIYQHLSKSISALYGEKL